MLLLSPLLPQFMLQLEEVEGLKQQLLPWHKDPTQPLVIEVGMCLGSKTAFTCWQQHW
jgi:hypothetical protein